MFSLVCFGRDAIQLTGSFLSKTIVVSKSTPEATSVVTINFLPLFRYANLKLRTLIRMIAVRTIICGHETDEPLGLVDW